MPRPRARSLVAPGRGALPDHGTLGDERHSGRSRGDNPDGRHIERATRAGG